jgi:excisionase family DNA binding protein
MTAALPSPNPTPGHAPGCTCLPCLQEALRCTITQVLADRVDRPTRSLTVQQAADLLQVKEDTIYREIKAGHLPALRVGAKYRLSSRVIEDLLAGRMAPV